MWMCVKGSWWDLSSRKKKIKELKISSVHKAFVTIVCLSFHFISFCFERFFFYSSFVVFFSIVPSFGRLTFLTWDRKSSTVNLIGYKRFPQSRMRCVCASTHREDGELAVRRTTGQSKIYGAINNTWRKRPRRWCAVFTPLREHTRVSVNSTLWQYTHKNKWNLYRYWLIDALFLVIIPC